jgi:hypothetical protein
MLGEVHTYDPSKILVTFHGLPITGFADGTFVNAERDSPSFSKKVGSDGEVARSKSADKSGTIKLTLLQTAQANEILSAELERDELTGHNMGPVSIEDLFGSTLVAGAQAWIERPSPVAMGKEADSREWTIHVADMMIHGGGNA